MIDRADPTRPIIRALIAILSGAALLLIVMILSGSKFDQTNGKAIATAGRLLHWNR
jgi:hypothetical protein